MGGTRGAEFHFLSMAFKYNAHCEILLQYGLKITKKPFPTLIIQIAQTQHFYIYRLSADANSEDNILNFVHSYNINIVYKTGDVS